MLRLALTALLALLVIVSVAVGGVIAVVLPQLPSMDALRDVRLQIPLRVYTSDRQLLAEFGEKRRSPVALSDVPDLFVKAFLAAEDQRFFEHPGVDFQALARAALRLIQTRAISQGASTITMQVARNFFLTPERTFKRKLTEILLALQMERELSKSEILELYLNKIFLGQRAYGIAAAAQVYFGKSVDQLDLAEMALIAGLPAGPSDLNPISNPEAATKRRAYVLERMLEQGFIDRAAYQAALTEPVPTRLFRPETQVEGAYLAEMVRAYMYAQYGDDAYTSGFNVITTPTARLQSAATLAVRSGLEEYDRRHGYRGPERHVSLSQQPTEEEIRDALSDVTTVGGLSAAVVVAVEEKRVRARTLDAGTVVIDWAGLNWARPYVDANRRGPAPQRAADVAKVGDVIRVEFATATPPDSSDAEPQGAAASAGAWRLAQVPKAQSAMVAIDPADGSVQALVGGFDFTQSKFNRVTQALRQPGSSFKPFVYSAALEAGFTPASFINDAPIVFDAPGLDNAWRPENYTGRYYGPTRLREALAMSRNLVSIRVLRSIGIPFALDHVARFGFDRDRLPANLSLALGSGEVAPMELVAAYAVFANGGYRVEPYFIRRIERTGGELVWQPDPARVCIGCDGAAAVETESPSTSVEAGTKPQTVPSSTAPRVIEADNAWLMTSMMQDVIRYGTAQRAKVLGRPDLSGKTGTTNDQKDAWFSGFNTHIVATAWVGFDQAATLGKEETGGRAALPIWINFMRAALQNVPESILRQPPGLITVRIDPATGLLARSGARDSILESFRPGDVPTRTDGDDVVPGHGASPEQLF